MASKDWTRDELIVAFNLYCQIEFSKINSSNKDIKILAPKLGRTVGSLAMKLANFARLDPVLRARGIRGLKGGSKGEERVWNEFSNNWSDLAFESEKILARLNNEAIENRIAETDFPLSVEGKEREAIVKIRVNQSFFRKAVMASYNNKCCITGLAIRELLVAGHIIPWAADEKNRVNPANGILMNAFHDKAFDCGLMTITPDYVVKFSNQILERVDKGNAFISMHGNKISLPQKFTPRKEFLDYHNTKVFRD